MTGSGTKKSECAGLSGAQLRFQVRKLGSVCWLLVAAALLTSAGCKRHTEQSLFPPSGEAAGWVRTGDLRTFAADDLWKYIDGEAERYMKAGVQSAATADYKFRDRFDAAVDIYTMQDAKGAAAILESEASIDVKPLQLGDEARLHSQSLVFRKGIYLTRIVAYEELPETQPALVQLGRAVEARLAGR